MQEQIMFQGHEFTLREDGLYETRDAFEFDDADWAQGENYPGYTVLLRKYNRREWPQLLAVDKHHSDLIQVMHDEEFNSIRVSTAISCPDGTITSLFSSGLMEMLIEQ